MGAIHFKKRNHIISRVKAKYWRTTHKYGVRLPKTVDEALKIDRDTGMQFWENTLNKEMKKAKVAYTKVDGCTLNGILADIMPYHIRREDQLYTKACYIAN